MTDKAKRIFALMRDPKRRAKTLADIDRDNPPSGPPSSPGGMKVLQEINGFDEDHERFIDPLKGVTDS